MRKISVLIFIKEREPGLLSIIDNREKSLVPLLGGVKIVDYYIGPLIHSGFRQIAILMDEDMVGVKDYLLYMYNLQDIRILSESDVYKKLIRALKLKRNESMLILRAEGMLVTEWERFIEFLTKLPDGSYEIATEQDETIGFFLREAKFVQGLKDKTPLFNLEDSKVDRTWQILTETLRSSVKRVHYSSQFFTLKTAFDYYKFHFLIMEDIENFARVLSLLPTHNEEENLSQVGGTGFVKDSYISSSCTVDGYVEHSMLFPHVKIGRNARVIDSIIMSNNYIGEGAIVQNTIVCENGQFSKVTPNIGEKARIGEDDTSGVNGRYPDFIYGGITLIGQNVEIPKGFRISRNCFISSDIDKALFRGRERVKAGDSVLSMH